MRKMSLLFGNPQDNDDNEHPSILLIEAGIITSINSSMSSQLTSNIFIFYANLLFKHT